MAKFVVVADAAVITTGFRKNGKPETARVLKGGVITAPENNEHIESLLLQKTIVLVTSKAELAEAQNTRLTAREAAAAAGAPDDPVQPPVAGVEPLPAPLPGVGEGNNDGGVQSVD